MKNLASVFVVFLLMAANVFAFTYTIQPQPFAGGAFVVEASYLGRAVPFWGYADVVNVNTGEVVATVDFYIDSENYDGWMSISYGGETNVNKNIDYDYGWLIGSLGDMPAGNYAVIFNYDYDYNEDPARTFWLTLYGG